MQTIKAMPRIDKRKLSLGITKVIGGLIAIALLVQGSVSTYHAAVSAKNSYLDRQAVSRVQSRNLIEKPEAVVEVKEVPVYKAADVDKQIETALKP